MMNSASPLVSPRRLAELYPDLFSIPTLQRWRSEGVGPPYAVLGPRRIAYNLSAIEAWLTERTVSSTSAAKELRERGLYRPS